MKAFTLYVSLARYVFLPFLLILLLAALRFPCNLVEPKKTINMEHLAYSYLPNRRHFEISEMCAFICSKQSDMNPPITSRHVRVPVALVDLVALGMHGPQCPNTPFPDF